MARIPPVIPCERWVALVTSTPQRRFRILFNFASSDTVFTSKKEYFSSLDGQNVLFVLKSFFYFYLHIYIFLLSLQRVRGIAFLRRLRKFLFLRRLRRFLSFLILIRFLLLVSMSGSIRKFRRICRIWRGRYWRRIWIRLIRWIRRRRITRKSHLFFFFFPISTWNLLQECPQSNQNEMKKIYDHLISSFVPIS